MADQDQKSLTINRVFDAPIDKVWQAWTDPEKIKKWWGPKGVNSLVNEWDLKEGGNIDIVMVAGEELGELKGQEWPMTGNFDEIDEEHKTLSFYANAIIDGKVVLKALCVVTLEKEDEGTKLNLKIVVTEVTPEGAGPLSGMEAGWNQQIDKLADLVK